METTRYPTNFLTTVRVWFAVEQRWSDGHNWAEVRTIAQTRTLEAAMAKAARYRAEIERGDYTNKDGEECPQPQLRIVQRVSEWTPLHYEI